jgi:glycosyltransferase involved in cell wall biosynthesis
MSVLFLLTSPKPVVEGTDAVFQDVSMLREAVKGEVVNLYPRSVPGSAFPQALYGFHALPALRRAERRCKVNHIFFSVAYPFPVLRVLRNPTVYTVVASLAGRAKPHNIERLRALRRIVVSNERDLEVLRSWGLSNGSIIPTGIDMTGLVPAMLDLGDELTLLMASAPWVSEQFDTKGIDILLEAVARDRAIKLILLWRGLLLDELRERISRLGINDRVEVVTERIAIADYLKRAHATVLLAKRCDIVKAYPHSLLESLLCGKPVILSEKLPMADYVQQNDCGVVVDEIHTAGFLAAVNDLRRSYDRLAGNAQAIDRNRFSTRAMIESYGELYGL